MRAIVLLVSFGVAVVSFTTTAAAQTGVPRYRPPAGPTISPYLDYFRRDTGLLNNYYNFVQPRRQMGAILAEQNAAVSDLNEQLRQVEGAIQQIQTPGLTPTGKAASFMNHSHYFPRASAPRR